MRTFWIILSFIAFGLIIPISLSLYKNYQVVTKGHIVDAIITHLPDHSKKSDFLKFSVNGKDYDKRIVVGTDNYRVGDTIQLRYLEGYKYTFLFADENPTYLGCALIVVFLILGLWCLDYAYKRQTLK